MKIRQILFAGGVGLLAVAMSAGLASAVQGQQPAAAPAAPTASGGAPLVEITKRCPGLRYVGRNATFEVVVTNRGTGPALNVVVTDELRSGVEFLSADSGGQREGGNVVWRLGTLEAGAAKTLKVEARCNQITTVRNTAKVAYCGEAQATCELVVKGIPAILLECVDDPDPVEVGHQTTYTITVTNQGSEVGTNIVVSCTLPPEQEFVKASGPTQGQAEGKVITFPPVPSLAPRAKVTFLVTTKGVKSGDSRFAVSMKSDQIASPVNETESTNIYE
jgi:uncharacterized repeat protein (TIGR01451 family)